MRQPKGNVEEAKRLLQYTDDTYRTIGTKTGCSHGTIARMGKEYRCNRMTPAERWKAEHDDLMAKYDVEKERNRNLAKSNFEVNKNAASFADKITQLESQLEAYQSNDNPQMVSKLNEAIRLKDESIRELDRACKRADEERDEAMQYAQEMKEKYEQVIKEAKEYEMEYEARYLNMKAQRDSLVTAYSMALEVGE